MKASARGLPKTGMATHKDIAVVEPDLPKDLGNRLDNDAKRFILGYLSF